MRTNVRVIRKQRRYSEEFKRAIVKDFESGQYSVVQLEKLHGIHNQPRGVRLSTTGRRALGIQVF